MSSTRGEAVVMYVISDGDIGGAQTWVLNQLPIISRYAGAVLVSGGGGQLFESFGGSKYIIRGLRLGFSFRRLFRLVSIMRRTGVTVAIASSAHAGVYTRVAALLCGVRCIYVSHGWSAIYNAKGIRKATFQLIERLLALLTERIICVSQSDFCVALEEIGIDARRLVYIPNGIPINHTSIVPSRPSGTEPLRLLFLGRFAHPKRQDLAAEAVSRVAATTLTCIGPGIEVYPWAKKIRAQFHHGIHVLPAEAPFLRYSDFHAVILISESEGLPYVLVEAIERGLPIIVSGVGGCPELARWGNGIVVNNNLDEIVAAITRMRDQYSMFHRRAQEARGRVDIAASERAYLTCYRISAV